MLLLRCTSNKAGSLLRITLHTLCVASCVSLSCNMSKGKALEVCHRKAHHVGNDAVCKQPDICKAGPDVLRQNRRDRLALVKI